MSIILVFIPALLFSTVSDMIDDLMTRKPKMKLYRKSHARSFN